MQLTIDKYTKMVAPLDVRDLELHTICYLRDLLAATTEQRWRRASIVAATTSRGSVDWDW
jgi:hypothetical protein